jgi:hypothetical protein
MKYTLIFLVLIKILLSHNIENDDGSVIWTRIITHVRQFKYESLRVYGPPIRLNNVCIYIKFDRHADITLYLFLTEAEATSLGLEKPHMKHDSGINVYDVNFKKFHANSLLTTLFQKQRKAEVFYFLSGLSYFGLVLENSPKYAQQKIYRTFEASQAEESIRIMMDFINHNTVHTRKGIQANVSKARNIQIQEVLDKLQAQPSTETLRQILILLNLTNRESVVAHMKFTVEINQKLVKIGSAYKFPLKSPKSEDLQKAFFTSRNELEDLTDNTIINDKINTLIDLIAETFLDEVKDMPYFEHYGIVSIFSQYMYDKYLRFDNEFKNYFLFAQKIFDLQLNNLIYAKGKQIVSCDVKLEFYNKIVESNFKTKDQTGLGGGIGEGAGLSRSIFSFKKKLFELQITKNKDLAEIVSKLEYNKIKDAECNFENENHLAISKIERYPRGKINGSTGECPYTSLKNDGEGVANTRKRFLK